MNTEWIVAKSDDSTHYFPDNQPYQFSIHLKQPLRLEGHWILSLREFYAQRLKSGNTKKRNVTDGLLYVYCSLCEPIIVNGERQPLLRRVQSTNATTWKVLLSEPFEIALRLVNDTVQQFDIYITDASGNPATFLTTVASVTLQLRRYPFII